MVIMVIHLESLQDILHFYVSSSFSQITQYMHMM